MAEKIALIVEDALNWIKQHQLALSEIGFKSFTARGYAEAVGMIRREKFDIAVIDLGLPSSAESDSLNGVFLLEHLAEKNTPVIVVTAHGFPKLVDEIYRDFGVFAIMEKFAFNKKKFKEYASQAMQRHSEVAQASKRKKARAREKLEELILEMLGKRQSQLPVHESRVRTSKKAQEAARLQVFISHSSKDKSLAGRLANDLQNAGIDVWYDSDQISVGDTIWDKIERGLSKCDYMIIILSPDAVASTMVRQELFMFLNEEWRRANSVILPVLYKDCDMPLLLKGRRFADFRMSYEAGYAELQDALGILNKNVEKPEK